MRGLAHRILAIICLQNELHVLKQQKMAPSNVIWLSWWLGHKYLPLSGIHSAPTVSTANSMTPGYLEHLNDAVIHMTAPGQRFK